MSVENSAKCLNMPIDKLIISFVTKKKERKCLEMALEGNAISYHS